MPRKTATLGFKGAQFDEDGRRVVGKSEEVLFMDFTHRSPRSPRSYRGKASGYDGHPGVREKDGRWAPLLRDDGTPLQRKRWTTALVSEALDRLHELAVAGKCNRCEVVEALLLDPVCRERALAFLAPRAPAGARRQEEKAPTATAAPQPAPAAFKETAERRRKVDQVLRELLAQGRTGADELQRVAEASGMTLAQVQRRLERLQREGAV